MKEKKEEDVVITAFNDEPIMSSDLAAAMEAVS